MPPSEGLKMLVSTMMTGHDDGNHVDGLFEMATWDVSRAHFCGEARRWIYTFLPEGHEQVGKLARLCRSMYGTRDAASIWGDTWSELLKDGSMKVEPAAQLSSAFAMEISKDCVMVMTSVWLHDRTFGKVLEKRFEVKQTGHVGFGRTLARVAWNVCVVLFTPHIHELQ